MHEIVEGVAVVGGGLSGLALAATLRARRFPVEILDAASEARFASQRGLCLWNGALTALEPTGVVAEATALGAPIKRLQIWSAGGQLLLDMSARYTPVGGLAVRTPPSSSCWPRPARTCPITAARP